MSRSTIPSGRSASAGFTLIEVLVALVVLAVSLAAISGLAASSIRSGLYIERHLAQVETARKIEAGLPDRNALTAGGLTGEMADQRWRIDSASFAADFVDPSAPTLWSPRRIIIRVQAPTGEVLEIDTVRLRKRADR